MNQKKTMLRFTSGGMALLIAVLAAGSAYDTAEASRNAAVDRAEAQASSNQMEVIPPEEAFEQTDISTQPKKSETVYVNLDPSGKPYETIVSDWIHNDKSGALFQDRSDLSNIVNVKGDEQPKQTGDSLEWPMSGTDLYYQGTSQKPLPFEVEIRYYLNGKRMEPEKLAGKSGSLRMEIDFRNTDQHQVEINGQQVKMYTPLMVVAGISLDGDVFSNVQVSDGTVNSDGDHQMIGLVSMPGMNESLNLGGYSVEQLNDLDFPESFTIEADVRDFEMGPIAIAATTQLPNLEDLRKTQDIDDMRQDLLDLQGVQDKFNLMDPVRDLRSLYTDQKRTEAAQLLIADIFEFYDLNKDIMDLLPKYVTEENIALYDRIRVDLKDSTVDKLLDDEVMFDLFDLVDDLSSTRLKDLADDYEELCENEALKKEFDGLIRVLKDPQTMQILTNLKGQLEQLPTQMTKAAQQQVKEKLYSMIGTNEESTLLNMLSQAGYPVDELSRLNGLSLVNSMDMINPEEEARQEQERLAEKQKRQEEAKKEKEEAAKPEEQEGTAPTEENTQEKQPQEDTQPEKPDVSVEEPAAEENDSQQSGAAESDETDAQTNETTEQAPAVSSQEEMDAQEKESTPEPQEQEIARQESEGQIVLTASAYVERSGSEMRTYAIQGMVDDYVEQHWEKILETQPEIAQQLEEMKQSLEAIEKIGDGISPELAAFLEKAAGHLEENRDNLETLLLMLEKLENWDLLDDVEYINDLRDDMHDLRPIIKDLQRDLKTSEMRESLHKAPETVEVLMKLKEDLETHRDIMESLRTATLQENVNLSRDMIATLDRLEAEDATGEGIQKLDDIDEILARKDAYVELSDQYGVFTQAPEGIDTEVKFVLKTDSIEKPEEPSVTVPQQEEQGFLGWLKGLVGKKD